MFYTTILLVSEINKAYLLQMPRILFVLFEPETKTGIFLYTVALSDQNLHVLILTALFISETGHGKNRKAK